MNSKVSNSHPEIHGQLKCCRSGWCDLEWGLSRLE